MEVEQAVLEAGGLARTSALYRACTRSQLRAAVWSGRVLRTTRGVYVLPGLAEHEAAAARLNGTLMLISAAQAHGWPVRLPPDSPQLLVPRGRNVPAHRRAGVEVRWGEVTPADLADRRTNPVRTVLDCARMLPLEDSLAVADSALRAGITRTELLLHCQRLPRNGRSRAYRVVELATAQAANPFESALRAIVHDIRGSHFEPQVWIGNIGRADLVDRVNKLVLEADSFEFHSDSASLNRDMERYNAFVCEGYLLLRFGWKHVMFRQDYVRATVASVVPPVGRSTGMSGGGRPPGKAERPTS